MVNYNTFTNNMKYKKKTRKFHRTLNHSCNERIILQTSPHIQGSKFASPVFLHTSHFMDIKQYMECGGLDQLYHWYYLSTYEL